jgi:hypothetical protein
MTRWAWLLTEWGVERREKPPTSRNYSLGAGVGGVGGRDRPTSRDDSLGADVDSTGGGDRPTS